MNDTTREIMAFIVINGSRHFHGYLMIENDLNEYQNLSEEEAKSKVILHLLCFSTFLI